LLDIHEPELVLIRQRNAKSAASYEALLTVMRTVKREIRRRKVSLRFLTAFEVKHFYRSHGYRNKQQIASALAKWYPELAWKLPAKRSIWRAENRLMTLFDAAATGVCFLGGVKTAENR
jgi:hypothetical protein